MKRMFASIVLSLLVAAALTGTASGQEAPTTTLEPSTTLEPTTAAPTTASPTTEAPATTVAQDPGSTTEAPTTTLGVIDAAGERVGTGSLAIGTEFDAKTTESCGVSGSLNGQELNIYNDEESKIGAYYGMASLGGNNVVIATVELGPLPLAVTAYRSVGSCNVDVVGIGAYSATASTATLDGIGFGVYPGDYASRLSQSLNVTATSGPATLDLAAAQALLEVPRPTIPGGN